MSLKRDKKIIEEWKQVDRMKQLNQRLYDELDVALMFILEYAERNNIVLPNRDRLFRMVENIHNTTNAISEYHGKINNNNSLQTDSQQRKQTPDKHYRTVVIVKYGILSRTLT
jgi:hypothetical protein